MKSIKLLCVAILGMVVGGAECAQQAVFDLPPNTPGLRNGNTQYKTVKGIQNQECVHVIVPGSEAANAVGVARAMMMNGNICFPKNGAQPTTPEAVEYSCANIDNRENSPITEWYMKMFGVIPFQNEGAPGPNDYIKAGWDHDAANAQRIISFDASVDGTMVDDPNIPGAQISRRALFEREFRKIASTSVGRVLLYRILIEIRRQQANKGCLENGIAAPAPVMASRRCSRSLEIQFARFSFNNIGRISVSNSNNPQATIGNNMGNYTNIVLYTKPLDVSLFHEMIHWFHQLRDPARKKAECNRLNSLHFYDNELGRHYWGVPNQHFIRNMVLLNASESVWYARINNLSFEEMRTVLGAPMNGGNIIYRQGDDLSENLYRRCIGIPLRFGYTNRSFFEDSNVISRVLDACDSGHHLYSTSGGNVGYAYGVGGRHGLGSFYINP